MNACKRVKFCKIPSKTRESTRETSMVNHMNLDREHGESLDSQNNLDTLSYRHFSIVSNEQVNLYN